MDSTPPPIASRFYARAFGLVTVGVLGYFLFRVLQPFFTSIIWATLLAFLFQPAYRKLVAKWNRPNLAAAAVTAIVVLTILAPLASVLTLFVRQAGDLVVRFQAEASERRLPGLQLILELGPVKALIDEIGAYTSLSAQELVARAEDWAQTGVQLLAKASGSLVVGAVNVVTTFSFTMFLLYFFVRDGRELWRRAENLVPMSVDRKRELRVSLGAVTKAVVAGTFATSLTQGTLIGIGFAIAGLPSPVVFGSLGALSSLIPVVGTALVWVPAVLTVFAQGSHGLALFLLLWCAILVVGSDNVVRPLVISGSTNVSTMLVLVGVIGGVSAFGFTGIFAGPVLLALVAALLRYADESRLGTRLLDPTPPPVTLRSLQEPPKPQSPPPVPTPSAPPPAST